MCTGAQLSMTWFTTKEKTSAVFYVFLDCTDGPKPFMTLNSKLDELASTNPKEAYETHVTYLIRHGGGALDFASVLNIADILCTYTFTRRITLSDHEPHLASIVIAHEVGKRLMQTGERDCILIVSPDKRIMQAVMMPGTPLIRTVHMYPTHDASESPKPSSSPKHPPPTTALVSPADIPVEAPPADIPVEAPPADIPVEAPPADIPVEAPPADIPVEAPPADIPVEAPPAEHPGQQPDLLIRNAK
jgi:hypothetical protein